LAKVPKARGGGQVPKNGNPTYGKSIDGRAATGIPKNTRSRLSKLADTPVQRIKEVAAVLVARRSFLALGRVMRRMRWGYPRCVFPGLLLPIFSRDALKQSAFTDAHIAQMIHHQLDVGALEIAERVRAAFGVVVAVIADLFQGRGRQLVQYFGRAHYVFSSRARAPDVVVLECDGEGKPEIFYFHGAPPYNLPGTVQLLAASGEPRFIRLTVGLIGGLRAAPGGCASPDFGGLMIVFVHQAGERAGPGERWVGSKTSAFPSLASAVAPSPSGMTMNAPSMASCQSAVRHEGRFMCSGYELALKLARLSVEAVASDASFIRSFVVKNPRNNETKAMAMVPPIHPRRYMQRSQKAITQRKARKSHKRFIPIIADIFEAQVESDDPPTIEELARQGIAARSSSRHDINRRWCSHRRRRELAQTTCLHRVRHWRSSAASRVAYPCRACDLLSIDMIRRLFQCVFQLSHLRQLNFLPPHGPCGTPRNWLQSGRTLAPRGQA
jgi:hypothetical protein